MDNTFDLPAEERELSPARTPPLLSATADLLQGSEAQSAEAAGTGAS